MIEYKEGHFKAEGTLSELMADTCVIIEEVSKLIPDDFMFLKDTYSDMMMAIIYGGHEGVEKYVEESTGESDA